MDVVPPRANRALGGLPQACVWELWGVCVCAEYDNVIF